VTGLVQAVTALGDQLTAPLAGAPLLALVIGSAVFGAVAVLLFKLATPQRRLQAARSALIGRLYEAALYQHSLPVIMQVHGRLARANLRYLACALPGLAVLLLPLLLVVPQLEGRFGRRALAVGETALVSVALTGDGVAAPLPSLAVGEGLVVEAGPVRVPATLELVWRVRAVAAGAHELRLKLAPGEVVTLPAPVTGGGLLVNARARHAAWWRQALEDPGVRPLPAGVAIDRLAIALPGRSWTVLGLRVHWLVIFTVVALAAGFALRRPLRVEF
jgi:hypothetical protein